MLVAAAVCPHPPLLAVGLGPEGDYEVDALRQACGSAVNRLRHSRADRLVVVGVADSTSEAPPRAGTLAPYGVRRRVALPGAETAPGPDMPLSLAVAASVLEGEGFPAPVTAAAVATDADAGESLELGRRLDGVAERVAVLAMADGAASRTEFGPLPFHPKAAGYDAAVVAALRSGRPQRITEVDEALAREVGATGLNALRVLAGAGGDAAFDADVLYDAAPYGVGYAVSVWTRRAANAV